MKSKLNIVGIIACIISILPVVCSFSTFGKNIQRETFGSIISINLIICIISIIINIICIIKYKEKNYIGLAVSIVALVISLYLFIDLNTIMLLPI